MSKPIKPFSKAQWKQLIEVSRFQRPATAWIKAGQILNIYTGEVCAENIAIFEDRIAYVGSKEPKMDEQTLMIDASQLTVVPGYIEPHAHPFQLYNPASLSEFALRRGTTTLVNDSLNFFLRLEQNQLEHLFAMMSEMPVKNFWWARLDPQNTDNDLKALFTPERVIRTLKHPAVIQAGELTAWKALLDGEEDIQELMYAARNEGKPIETHNPGASVETLSAVTAAGVTCCHESITADEVLRRLRLGLYATLRYSSIRPDLPDLIKGLLEEKNLCWNRMMMTTDGSTPFFFEKGFTDYLVQLAIDAGLPPIEAYRMVTLNPAVYYGLDQELGGIAPGRLADILFLEDLYNPTPVMVMADGKIVVEKGQLITPLPEVKWEDVGIGKMVSPSWKATPEWFSVRQTAEKYPVAEMMNAAILMQTNERLPVENGEVIISKDDDYLYAALLDPRGNWITTGIMKGFGKIDALASSYTLSQDIIVLGKDRNQMAQAVNRVMEIGGGICLLEGGKPIFELSLPLFGGMSLENMDTLIAKTGQFVDLLKERGHLHEDPIYSLLFFSATHLPTLRFTRQGVLAVKTGKILVPVKKLEAV